MNHNRAILVFLILNIADAASTHLGLHRGLPEGMPLPAAVLGAYGEWALYSLKAPMILLVLVTLLLYRSPWLWRWGLGVCNGIVAVAVVLNLAQAAIL